MILVRSIYYLLMFAFVAGTTLVVPTLLTEESELTQLNTELGNLKRERGTRHLDLNDPEVRAILDKGTVYFKDEYVFYANTIAVVVCLVALVFAYFFRKTGRYDSLYVFGIFTILLLIGVVKFAIFVVIATMCITSQIVKRNEFRKLRDG